MKRVFIAVLLSLALPALAAEPCPPIKQVFKGPIKCKKGLVKTTCGGKVRCLPRKEDCPEHRLSPAPVPRGEETKQVRPPAAPPATAPAPVAAAPALPAPVRATAPAPKAQDRWHVGPYGQFGSGIIEPRSVFTHQYSTVANGGLIEWDIGFHAHYLPARLGARAYFAGPYYGPGAQLQLYLWQGEGLEVHVDGGFLYSLDGLSHPSVVDVDRRWDFQYGLGLEYPIVPAVVLMLDARASQPVSRQVADPWTHEGGNIATNALHQFHLLAGLMYRY